MASLWDIGLQCRGGGGLCQACAKLVRGPAQMGNVGPSISNCSLKFVGNHLMLTTYEDMISVCNIMCFTLAYNYEYDVITIYQKQSRIKEIERFIFCIRNVRTSDQKWSSLLHIQKRFTCFPFGKSINPATLSCHC